MEKSIIKRYGLAIVGILAIANVTVFLFKDEEGHSPKVARTIYNADTLNTIPSWLRAELENTNRTIDIFQITQSNVADKIIISPTKEVDPIEELPTDSSAFNAEPQVTNNKIKILAINLSGNRPSGLIEYKGKVQTVFTGNIIDDQYVVRKISDNTIWFDAR